MYYKLEHLSHTLSDQKPFELIKKIPDSGSKLDFSCKELNESENNMQVFQGSLNAKVTYIDASWNNLGRNDGVKLWDFFDLFYMSYPNVRYLNLCGNQLNEISIDSIESIFGEFFYSQANNISHLDLSCNKLGSRSAILCSLIECFSPRLTHVSFASNNLNCLTNAELTEFFSCLPFGVIYLDLSGNNLQHLPSATLITLLSKLPSSVQFVSLVDGQIIDLVAFKAVEQLINQVSILVLDGKFDFDDAVQLPIEINETRLNQFIQVLEKENTSITFLTCALLLEGKIPNTAEIKDNHIGYMEKRTHDAIDFYTKAATDAKLKPIVEFLLWELKITTEIPSIKQRLAFYDVTPQNTPIIASYNKANKNREGVAITLNDESRFFANPLAKRHNPYSEEKKSHPKRQRLSSFSNTTASENGFPSSNP